MSAEIISVEAGVITGKITGRLKYDELTALQDAAAAHIEKLGEARLLILLEDFQGWDQAGDWSDVSFAQRYDDRIKKIALVCDPQWSELALLFASEGLRQFPIQYFQPSELASAQAWLSRP